MLTDLAIDLPLSNTNNLHHPTGIGLSSGLAEVIKIRKKNHHFVIFYFSAAIFYMVIINEYLVSDLARKYRLYCSIQA
ncbi:hypothetical protein [Zooshikella harenae]|uniref:Uncharacterized protein n=1 Tax=Zooshikella harenae TaxID=2827238 RepID=A0ABS5Z7B7_9GAMM|nr:hypothetical protein [Zooshikella harenae]MBU2709828.1 hypothetical protein [Zooshikella harenae]